MRGTPSVEYSAAFRMVPNGPVFTLPPSCASNSPIVVEVLPSPAIPELPQIGGDGGVQAGGLLGLLAQRRGEPAHLFVEWLGVLLNVRGADVAARGEDMAVSADLVDRCGPAAAGGAGVLAGALIAAPGVVGAGDPGDIVVGELAVGSIDQRAHLPGVD